MPHELVFTAAPRGLLPGASGLCVVAMSPDLGESLTSKLSGDLSEYDHRFPAGSGKNPPRYSYLRGPVGNQKVRILSFVCDTGLDPFTKRNNLLAHHLVLGGGELCPAGPAALAETGQVFLSRWSGEPRLLTGRSLPKVENTVSACPSWKTLVEDPGWAGVVAEHVLRDSTEPLYLIGPGNLAWLRLLREAIALLPPERRWDATFSTFFTGLPRHMNCLIRCVHEGSKSEPEARAGRCLVLRECPGKAPPETIAVQSARVGRVIDSTTSGAVSLPPPTPKQAPRPKQVEIPIDSKLIESVEVVTVTEPDSDADADAPPALKKKKKKAKRAAELPPRLMENDEAPPKPTFLENLRANWWVPAALGTIIIFFILFTLVRKLSNEN